MDGAILEKRPFSEAVYSQPELHLVQFEGGVKSCPFD